MVLLQICLVDGLMHNHYGADKSSGLIDYNDVARQAEKIKPKLLITGQSQE